MTRVAILPVPTGNGNVSYRAVAGNKHSQGKTAGEALDAITAQLPKEDAGALVIVQTLEPDGFFNAAQQQRLAELMECWRSARDSGDVLPETERAELEALVEEELRASGKRAGSLADESGR